MLTTMTPGCFVFIATSLDGFIARRDGSIDWLERANTTITPGEDCGFAAFMDGVDGIVMGRNTFDIARAFPEWLYGATPLVVLSRTLTQLPEGTPASVSLSSKSPRDVVADLASRGLRRLYVDGGLTVQSFLAAGLIDEIVITTIPVLLGSGLPLFGSVPEDVWLEHVSTQAYDFGFVQSRYRVIRSREAHS
jgi:dihydrofolate reductase